MSTRGRQLVAIAFVLAGAGASIGLLAEPSRHRAIEAGFWFEPVAFDSPRLGGSITAQEKDTIASVAMSELTGAFAGLRIRFSDRRTAKYRVHVVQELRDLRFQRHASLPAESRGIAGIGGQGAVNFSWHANSAVGYAPPDADRATIIAAIGRGIGRAAVHEFTHVLLLAAPIHDSTNIRSYEYRSAARREQYYGPMQWDL